MTYISYAQNFEDVMLWRALRHVKNGFYIDIGAQDPVVDSVSLLFYEHGWSGMNVEPTAQYYNMLLAARKRDTNFQVTIGTNNSGSTFYTFDGTGLSTADKETALRHSKAGFSFREVEVGVLTLDSLFEALPDDQIVHWMKIDVEGQEQQVLESWVTSKVRPWILVIESTKPLTREETFLAWEANVTSKSYRFAYFDGLNRYYVSAEHEELLEAFRVPPNIFDGFVLSGQSSQPFYRINELKIGQADAKAQQARLEAQEAALRAQRVESERDLAEIRAREAETHAREAETHARDAGVRAKEAEATTEQVQVNAAQAKAIAVQMEIRAEQASVTAQNAETMVQQVTSQLQGVYASKAWRSTAPLRWIAHQSRQHLPGLSGRTKHAIKRPLIASLSFVQTRPLLKATLVNAIAKLGLAEQLRPWYRGAVARRAAVSHLEAPRAELSFEDMTPRAKHLYQQLQAAIENEQNRNAQG